MGEGSAVGRSLHISAPSTENSPGSPPSPCSDWEVLARGLPASSPATSLHRSHPRSMGGGRHWHTRPLPGPPATLSTPDVESQEFFQMSCFIYQPLACARLGSWPERGIGQSPALGHHLQFPLGSARGEWDRKGLPGNGHSPHIRFSPNTACRQLVLESQEWQRNV